MHLSWILVAAVWCIFGRTESASIEGAYHPPDAHLIGGDPVDTDTTRPIMGVLLVKEGQKTVRSCVATWVKERSDYQPVLAYFVTAAECFDRGL